MYFSPLFPSYFVPFTCAATSKVSLPSTSMGFVWNTSHPIAIITAADSNCNLFKERLEQSKGK